MHWLKQLEDENAKLRKLVADAQGPGMGPIVDRTREFLSATDIAVATTRRMLFAALEDFKQGKLPPGSARRSEAVVLPNPIDIVLDEGRNWKEVAGEPVPA